MQKYFVLPLLLFLFSSSFPSVLQAQQPYQLTKRFTPADGLVDIVTRDGITDTQGYLWIATNSGLSRYDGHSFKNFYQNLSDSTSLCSNVISDFLVDKAGSLWMATDFGLAKYDPETEAFQCFRQGFTDEEINNNNTFTVIYEDEEGILWLGTSRRGLCRFDPETAVFKTYMLNKPANNENNNRFMNSARNIIPDVENPDLLWIAGTQAGIYTFNKETEQLQKLKLSPYSIQGVPLKTVAWFALYMDQAGELWAGGYGVGLYKIDTATGNWERIPLPKRTAVLDIKAIDNRFLYIPTIDASGVLKIDRESYDIEVLHEYESNQRDQQNIGKIYFDPQQRLWAFSRAGVLLFDPLSTKISKYRIPNAGQALHIVVDQNSDYLVTAINNKNKFYKLSEDKQTIKSSLLPDPSTKYYLKYTTTDCEGNIWFTDNTNLPRLIKYDINTSQFSSKVNRQRETLNIKDLLIGDDSCNLWLLAWQEGIFKYDIKRDTFFNITRDNSTSTLNSKADIIKMLIDSRGYLWITTQYDGVHVFDTKRNEFIKHFARNIKASVNSRPYGVVETIDHKIWVSIGQKGIFEINPDEDWSIKLINQQQGLPSNQILDLVADDNGDIWMAAFQGLIRYDYNSKNFLVYQEQEGVSNLFQWELTLKKTKKGEIFLGAREGEFYLFHPDSLPLNSQIPRLAFTDFEVAGTYKSFDKALNYLNKITLPYEENFFSIHFAALNFTKPENNHYQYYLEGYDKNWIDNANQTFASYTNVKEGKYIFHLRAANNDGVWNMEGISIPIHILPPWYRTWWAYLTYLGVIISSCFAAYQVYFRRQSLKKQLAQEQEQINRLKEIDEAKTQFYTNITHEFRTPLTVILGLADELQVHPEVDWKKRLQMIHRNGDQLLQLINQMLDLSKLKSGMLQPNYVQGDLILFIRYLTESYQSFVMNQQKNLSFFSVEEQLIMDYDPEKVERIVGNLLSNAIKFTPQYGKITVGLEQVRQDLVIKVTDTGIGISENEIAHIFDRFYQAEAQEKYETEGTGIGLALVKEIVQLLDGKIEVSSKLNEGTTFEVYLPIHNFAPFENNSYNTVLAETTKIETPHQETLGWATVLVVEDNKDVRDFIKIILENRFNVLEAKDGHEGWLLAKKVVPDLIITDLMMPQMDGLTLTEHLRDSHITDHIPIIILTAKAYQSDKIEGLRKGAEAYISKPFDALELQTRIAEMLKQRQRLRRAYAEKISLQLNQIEVVSKDDQFLKSLLEYVEIELDNPDFDIEGMAKHVNMSRSQLYRKLKALTDESPLAFVRNLRLQRAKELLIQSSDTITAIAYQLGYSSVSYFTKSFKEKYGLSPRQFQKNGNTTN
ncbi:MAG: ATP-binding protein [Bacteroidota bacterium]